MLTSESGETEWRAPRPPITLLTKVGTSITEDDVEGGEGLPCRSEIVETFVRLRAMKESVLARPSRHARVGRLATDQPTEPQCIPTNVRN